ncbi:thymocyte nuclear protein 1 [Arapaima gigas]
MILYTGPLSRIPAMPPKKQLRGKLPRSREPAAKCEKPDLEDSHEEAVDELHVKKRKATKLKNPTEKMGNNRGAPTEKRVYCHWLMKSEPESRLENGIDVKFGIEDLKALPSQTSCWDGVRNYQARNFMKDMKEGQVAFFYHSNCKEPGIVGVMKVSLSWWW